MFIVYRGRARDYYPLLLYYKMTFETINNADHPLERAGPSRQEKL